MPPLLEYQLILQLSGDGDIRHQLKCLGSVRKLACNASADVT